MMEPPSTAHFHDKKQSLNDLLANAFLVSKFLDHQNDESYTPRDIPVESRIDSMINQLNLDLEKELASFSTDPRRTSSWTDHVNFSSRNRTSLHHNPNPSKNRSIACLGFMLLFVALVVATITLALVFTLSKDPSS
ncbi:hypothetical protein DSO57_1038727 [Entomophthora muscae]|uniref:Uncharacterized protein n=1 Tax=Entomophthora muscae TaxID=34485 RepID=A0ACC2RDB8_9FUNG|nr:hypothetical protein DSO57_1038727 [Entomophthora muscae]